MPHRQKLFKFRPVWKLALLLPLVGLLFWLTTGWFDQQVLSQTRTSTTRLEAEGSHQVELSFRLNIVSIDAVIERTTQVTEVSIRTIGSPLEEMEFKFPVTEFAAVETAIAKEIGLPVPDIHTLIRYRINP